MSTNGPEGATPAVAAGDEKSNSLWNVLPTFDPSVDDPKEYVDKVKFLHGVCPSRDKGMLAPRLAMLKKGTAWSQIKQADPQRLADPAEGIKLILAAVATWEEAAEHQTYEKFEKAIYRVTQKNDESVVSYVNRMAVAFQELGEVALRDVQSFVMLRQSALQNEDKKKVITMTNGDLSLKVVEKSMRSLATKVLNTGTEVKKKTYPANYVEEDNDDVYMAHDEEGFDEDFALQSMADQGDEDAQTVTEFEDQLIDVRQESQELSLCFSAYAEARSRIRHKLNARGFWPPKGGAGKGKGGRKGVMKGFKRRHQTLADRIASSSCRICGMKGHWKWECPRKSHGSGTSTTGGSNSASNADINMMTKVSMEFPDEEVVDKPPNNMTLSLSDLLESHYQDPISIVVPAFESSDVQKHEHGVNDEFSFMTEHKKFMALDRYLKVASLESRLRGVCFDKNRTTDFLRETESVLTTEVECPAIIDTGASKSVIGRKKVKGLINSLPTDVQQRVQYGKSETVFRFGNNGTLSSVGVVFIPFGDRWMKLEIVDGETPFLLSNAFLKATTADVHSTESQLYFRNLGIGVPLKSNPKGLYTVELSKILKAVSRNSEVESRTASCEVVTNVISLECKKQSREQNNTAACLQRETPPEPAAEVAQLPKSASDCFSRSPDLPDQSHGVNACGNLWNGKLQGAQARCRASTSSRPSLGFRKPGARSDSSASWSDHTSPVGRADLSGGQTPRSFVHSSVQPRHQVHGLHEEPQPSDIAVGNELSELCQGDGHASGKSSSFSGHPQGCGDIEFSKQRVGCGGEPSTEADAHHAFIYEAWSTGANVGRDPGHHGTGERCGEGAEDSHADGYPSARAGASEAAGEAVTNNEVGPDAPLPQECSDQVANMSTLQDDLQERTQVIQRELDALAENLQRDVDILATMTQEVHAPRSKSATAQKQTFSCLDILEVYCEENSRLTEVATKMGLKARRFTKADGDLRTMEGRAALWKILTEQRPRHVWMAPECGPWGNFSRLNMCRSSSTRHKILSARAEQQTHLELCREVYEFQVMGGGHFHIEQPQGSEVFDQPVMEEIVLGTLKTVFDMCEVGKLRVPEGNNFLRKRTIVRTTSREFHESLDARYCNRRHKHQPIEGKIRYLGK